MPRRISLVLLFAIPALIVAACGGGAAPSGGADPSQGGGASTAPSSAPSAEPSGEPAASGGDDAPGTTLTACEVITAEDIKGATGMDAAAGELQRKPNTLSPDYTECRYRGDYGSVVVQLDPNIGDRVFNAAKKVSKDAKDIPGIGDGAFWTEQNRSLYAVKGKVDVLLRMSVGEDNEEVATDLADRAISKL